MKLFLIIVAAIITSVVIIIISPVMVSAIPMVFIGLILFCFLYPALLESRDRKKRISRRKAAAYRNYKEKYFFGE